MEVKKDIPDPFAGKVQTCGAVVGAEFGRPAENCTCNVRLTAVYNFVQKSDSIEVFVLR